MSIQLYSVLSANTFTTRLSIVIWQNLALVIEQVNENWDDRHSLMC